MWTKCILKLSQIEQCMHPTLPWPTKCAQLQDINLLIFDECHHGQKNHAYKRIMAEFYHPAKAVRPVDWLDSIVPRAHLCNVDRMC